jgi:hypothetical protein
MQDRGALIFVAVSASLVAFSAYAAATIIIRDGLGTNGAAWIQAAGSIAAIAGAVWLFRSETIRRRRERRAAGEQIAWAVRFVLGNAELEARAIAAELIDRDVLRRQNPGRHWLLQSENCQNVLKVFAERTDHIHPVLNQVASNALLLLRQLDEDIRKASDFIDRGERPSMELTSDINRYEGHFERLRQMLDERMRGILFALDRGGDALPKTHLKIWKVPKGYQPPDDD